MAVLLAMPLSGGAQTVRADFDYDGDFDVSDVTTVINYLLIGDWGDIPISVDRDTFMVKDVPFVMVHVEAGILTRDDGGMYNIREFWIGATEVTQGLWAAVMGGRPDNPSMAVEFKSWLECVEFIDSLNALTGMEFRLPTANEWEFAARGGNLSRGYTYCGGNDLDVVGWYKGNSWSLKPVALLKCNELGIYDMSGNVTEWCNDTYGSPTSGMRIHCGGSNADAASNNTPSVRAAYGYNMPFNYSGFRLAL